MAKRPRRNERFELELARQLEIRGITGWEREYRFHPHRMFRFDFAFPAIKVAIEIEGGTFGRFCPVCKRSGGGRHTSGPGHRADCEKYNDAAWLGWRVFRFPSDQVNKGAVLLYLTKYLRQLKEANGTKVEDQGHQPEAADGHA